jgi:thiol-disulfide isomerase/thioredoxin
MTRFKMFLSLAGLALLGVAVGQAQEKKIVMTHVKYDGLKQEILKHRGKVVVVDFWATWCINCKQAFPHFIEMQKKYADKGLIVISVSVDEKTEDPANIESANKYLNDVKSPFRNLLLDEPSTIWSDKFGFESLPAYFVFDRQGKWIRYRAADYKKEGVLYDELEKLVVKMLDEK